MTAAQPLTRTQRRRAARKRAAERARAPQPQPSTPMAPSTSMTPDAYAQAVQASNQRAWGQVDFTQPPAGIAALVARGATRGAGSGRRAPGRAGSGPARTPKGKRPTQQKVAEGESAAEIAAALGVDKGLLSGNPRQTLPVNANVLGMLPYNFLARRQYQAMDLTTLNEGAYSAQQVIDLLADAWPELSLALWNFMRLAASEYTYEVRTPDNTAEDTEGKAELDAIVARANKNWGGFRALVNQWVMSVVLQGACAGETIPNANVTDVVDIVTCQPWTVYFQRDLEQNYVAFQWQPILASLGGVLLGQTDKAMAPAPQAGALLSQGALAHGGFRQLNTHTFGYVPLDAEVDDPYGRMPFAPVLQLVAFDAQLLKDLRQWSHVHAFGRLDVSVVAEMVQQMMPAAVKGDAEKEMAWRQRYLGQVQQAYNTVGPDDTFIHWDNVKVNTADASGQTMDIDKLVRVLERRIFRALKQLPILMGSNEGTTETWGTLQMEVYAKGVASIQATVAALVEKLLTVAMRVRGRASVVRFEFATLRSVDRMSEAKAEALEIKNAAAKRDEGWITQDEASIQVTGSKAVADAPGADPEVAPLQPDAATPAGVATGQVPAPPAAPGQGQGQDKSQTPSQDAPEGAGAASASKDDTADGKNATAPTNAQSGNATPPTGTTDQPTEAATDASDDTKGEQADKKDDGKDSKRAEEPDPDAKKASARAARSRGRVSAHGRVRVREERALGEGPAEAAVEAEATQPLPVQSTGALEDVNAMDAGAKAADQCVDLTPSQGHTGVMVALMLEPPAAIAMAQALGVCDGDGDEDDALPGAIPPGDYHITLTYNGDTLEEGVTPDAIEGLRAVVARWVADAPSLPTGNTTGVAMFQNEEGRAEPLVALVNIPGLAQWRADLFTTLVNAVSDGRLSPALAPVGTFEYAPHITLAYQDPEESDQAGLPRLPRTPLSFGRVTVAAGGQRDSYPIGRGSHRPDDLPPQDDPGGDLDELGDPDPNSDHEFEWAAPSLDELTATGENGGVDPSNDTPLQPAGLVGPVNLTSAPTLELQRADLSDHAAIRAAMQEMVALALLEGNPSFPTAQEPASERVSERAGNRTPPPTQPTTQRVKPHSAGRVRVTRGLAADVAAHLKAFVVPRSVIDQAITLHTKRDLATHVAEDWPELARAITTLADTPPTGASRLSDEGLDALRASILRLLQSVFPDWGDLIADIITEWCMRAYDLAGQEALDEIGLDDLKFKLASQNIAEGIRATVQEHSGVIDQTTRERVANTIAASLDLGMTADETAEAVENLATYMAEQGRADRIADYEISWTYNDASRETWQRNGVGFKVWRTADEPDPQARNGGGQPCIDNSYAGAIPIDALFPSGDDSPPAHGNCRCELGPASDTGGGANWDSLSGDWTGGEEDTQSQDEQ